MKQTSKTVADTTFNVNAEFTDLGASLDGAVSCSCHGKTLLEKKCPHKYRNGFSGWDSDIGFLVSFNECMDEGHHYHFKLQHQILVSRFEKNYSYVWTKAKTNKFILITVRKDNNFRKKLTEKFNHLFEIVMLPELVSRKKAVENTENEKLYCICQRASSLPMIACDGTNCRIEWFHYACVKIEKALMS